MSGPQTTSNLTALDREECLKLLGYGSYVGRVGFRHDGQVMILPVNYLLDQDRIVIRTVADSELGRLDGAEVAFEVDTNAPLEHAGWSVLVRGTAHRLEDPEEQERLRRGPLRSWAWDRPDAFLWISIDTVTGRRVGAPEAP